ncbi:hypothetical protein KAR91_37060 [Candidatus Pacearchaeota archaeon]|nr:hypothetical protein [Candidatus Pacearchaeota archaeon]
MNKTAPNEDSQVFGTLENLDNNIRLLEETIVELETALLPVQVDTCPKDGDDGKVIVEEAFCPLADRISGASKWVRCLRDRIRANLERVKL